MKSPFRPRMAYYRQLSTSGMQQLESRQLLAIISLDDLQINASTAQKPQSKVWQHDNQWWAVLADKSETWVWQLEDTTWVQALKISDSGNFEADIDAEQELAHVLLFNGTNSEYVTLEYSREANTYQPWGLQPETVDVILSSGVETATIQRDSIGRLWIASDTRNEVEVRYSDSPYNAWSDPIEIASGISSDDISAITFLPEGKIGVFWSDQNSERFGFRYHIDGATPSSWSTNEVPGDESALDIGGGMADDHINLAVGTDGTLYAAVKTSYDKAGQTKLGLLVRRPNGIWDPLYSIENSGTRPIVVLNEYQNKLLVAFTKSEGGANIVFRESPLDTIQFSARQILMQGSYNNVTSAKRTNNGEVVMLAADGQTVGGVRFLPDNPLPSAEIVGRYLFYNNSLFDGYDAAPNAADDTAIATDKHALLPGEDSTASNYSSFARGLNGVMIDIANLATANELSLADFQFRVADSSQIGTWNLAPLPASFTVREGAGHEGSDRITLIWNDLAISSTWLQIRMLATEKTHLNDDDVFYFGNLPGDAGDVSNPGLVDATDFLTVRNAIATSSTADIENHCDFNRDGAIDQQDLDLILAFSTSLRTSLKPIRFSSEAVSEGEGADPFESDAIYAVIAMEQLRQKRNVVTYQTRERQKLLVESDQSMPNQFESTCWVDAQMQPVAPLQGISLN